MCGRRPQVHELAVYAKKCMTYDRTTGPKKHFSVLGKKGLPTVFLVYGKAFAMCPIKDTRQTQRRIFDLCRLPSVTLGKFFAESIQAFVKCSSHSTNIQAPIVRVGHGTTRVQLVTSQTYMCRSLLGLEFGSNLLLKHYPRVQPCLGEILAPPLGIGKFTTTHILNVLIKFFLKKRKIRSTTNLKDKWQ